MTETLTLQDPEAPEAAPDVAAEVAVAEGSRREPLHEAPVEDGLVAGRPIEDRSFEIVEAGVGAAFGAAIGTAVLPGLGTAVGGVVGAAAGFVAGEALERHEGKVARTTDAVDDEPVPHG